MVLTAEGLSPNKEIVNVLRGTISEPVQTVSQKPREQGQLVTERLALEGEQEEKLRAKRSGVRRDSFSVYNFLNNNLDAFSYNFEKSIIL